ncbi:MAG: carboxypeptidase regulatory-like domain-containing protein [Bryobacteraceae bacterium]
MRLFVFLLFASLASAQAPEQTAPPTEAPKKARIEGSVVSLTGEAIPRTQVRLNGSISVQNGQVTQGAAFTATSGDDGKFAIENIDAGRNYQLSVQRPGFVPARYGARSANSAGAPISLEAGQVLKGISISMTPQGVISGRVTDQSGDPVQGAMVAVMRKTYQRGSRQLQPQSTMSTNDQGEYRVANLAPGRYYVVVSGARLGLPASSSKTANVTTYYPNAPDPQGAAPVDITPGSEVRGLDVRLRQGAVFSIRGKAVDANGAPVIGTIVTSVPAGDQGGTNILSALNRAPSQTRAPEGTFEIPNLPPGTHVLQVLTNITLNGTPAPKMTGRLEVTVADSDVAGLIFPLSSGSIINGKVSLENGDITKLLPPTPAGQQNQPAALTLVAGLAGFSVSGGTTLGMAIGLMDQTMGSTTPVQVKSDGTFTADGVAASKFQVQVGGLPLGHYVKSMTFGGTDVIKAGLDLTAGGGGALNIVLSGKAADVTGVVRPQKEESVAGVMVTLWPRDPQAGTQNNGMKQATTDQNGGFTFSNLAPGVYYAAAWEDIETGLAQWRDFATLFTSDAGKLELAEGAHAATEIKLIPIAKIKAAEEKLP